MYLEIIGGRKKGRNRFSEYLKNKLKDDTLAMMRNEKHYPDIVGFVQKDVESEKEIIIAEVKDEPLTIEMLVQAKTYQEIFNAKFAFLLSTFDYPAEKVSYLLNKPSAKGDITIIQFEVTYKETGDGYFVINAKFKESIPEAFKGYFSAREIDLPLPVKPNKIVTKIYNGFEIFYYLILKGRLFSK